MTWWSALVIFCRDVLHSLVFWRFSPIAVFPQVMIFQSTGMSCTPLWQLLNVRFGFIRFRLLGSNFDGYARHILQTCPHFISVWGKSHFQIAHWAQVGSLGFFRMPPPDASWDRVRSVVVLGLHKSGTHAATKFLHEHFSVSVEPRQRRGAEGDGVAYLPSGQKLWKHTCPGYIRVDGENHLGVVIVTRHLVPWLASLVEQSFNIRPSSDNKCYGRFP